MSHFNSEIEAFVDSMVSAHESWLKYDKTVGADKRRALGGSLMGVGPRQLIDSMSHF
jgi:hypothetical protein